MSNRLLFGADTAAEALGELVDTATGINDFLLASVERVAVATYVYVQVFTQGRCGYEVIAAAAANSYRRVVWMNFWFHDSCLFMCAATRTFAEHRTSVSVSMGSFREAGMLPESGIKAREKH